MAIKRRKFLRSALLGLAGIGLGAVYVLRKDSVGIIKAALRDQLPYLRISEADAERFARELIFDLNRYGFGSRSVRAFDLYAQYYRVTGWKITRRDVHSNYEKFNNYVARNFLLASDFFYSARQANQQVNYLGLYSPYSKPCMNPFSQIDNYEPNRQG